MSLLNELNHWSEVQRKALLQIERLFKSQFIIGTDCYDDDIHAYCLGRVTENGNLEIILSKSMRAGEEFEQEVENISKYFNAQKIESKKGL